MTNARLTRTPGQNVTSGCRCSPRARLVSFREPRSLSGVKLPASAMERNLKNVLLLSLGFLLLFTAYGGLQSLQVGVRRPRDLTSGTPPGHQDYPSRRRRGAWGLPRPPSPVLYTDVALHAAPAPSSAGLRNCWCLTLGRGELDLGQWFDKVHLAFCG